MKTVKSDWLNNLLSTCGAFVSGDSKFSEYLGLPTSIPVAMRFVYFGAGSKETLLFFLTIETDSPQFIQSFTSSSETLKRLEYFSKAFKNNFFVLFYPPVHGKLFNVYDVQEFSLKSLNRDELNSFFAQFDPQIVQNRGAWKDINKSTNDSFQIWTRQNLSRSCVINDIDAFYLTSDEVRHNTFFELKRIKENYATWLPYTDDIANYVALLKICQQYNGLLRVIAYNANPTEMIALHTINTCSNNEIIGRRIIIKPAHVTVHDWGEKYVSNRRRVKRY